MKCNCPTCRRLRLGRRLKVAGGAALLGLVVFLAFWSTGCGTVVQSQVHAQNASFDGGAATSGILQLEPGGAIVTAHFRERYAELVKLYGTKFLPALDPEQGFAPADNGSFRITSQTLEHFLIMAEWRRMGRPPATH